MSDTQSNKPTTIKIDDVEYVRRDMQNTLADKVEGMIYSVVRTYSAGVHIGYIKEFGIKHPQHAVLVNSRRLHYWTGAASLSQVAMDGVGDGSRIAVVLPIIELTDVIEIIPCSAKSAEYFKGVKEWKI